MLKRNIDWMLKKDEIKLRILQLYGRKSRNKYEFLVCIIRICSLQIFCFESSHGYVGKTHLGCIPAEASVSCSQQRVSWRLLLSLFTNYLHQTQINNIMLLCIVWLYKPERFFLWENESFNSFQTEGWLWIREWKCPLKVVWSNTCVYNPV